MEKEASFLEGSVYLLDKLLYIIILAYFSKSFLLVCQVASMASTVFIHYIITLRTSPCVDTMYGPPSRLFLKIKVFSKAIFGKIKVLWTEF